MTFNPQFDTNGRLVLHQDYGATQGQSDSYKLTHWNQYPPATTRIFSFFESRGGPYQYSILFGLQYILLKHFVGRRVTASNIALWKKRAAAHFGNDTLYNEAGWDIILNDHDGRLPLHIRAVEEGMPVPVKNALITVEGTDDRLPWLTNYFETLLSQVWYPMTVATQSWAIKQGLRERLLSTGSDAGLQFSLHNFGYRGSTCQEAAEINSAAHLTSFMGTDTLAALDLLEAYYGQEDMPGFSVVATEHSTTTSWGRTSEASMVEALLRNNPTGIVSVVGDSYDIFDFAQNILGKQLHSQVLARDGKVVLRPDSGDPVVIVPQLLAILGAAFGYTVNDKGYKVLNPKVGLIQGDGIDRLSIFKILDAVIAAGWAAENVVFGSGGGLIQKMDRDTMKCAFKCSAAKVAGAWVDVFKDPITDAGKRSKKGRLELVLRAGIIMTVRVEDMLESDIMLLQTVFENGAMQKLHTFEDIRQNASAVVPYETVYVQNG
jgi:nicotinamide phosphoribosyltransferase